MTTPSPQDAFDSAMRLRTAGRLDDALAGFQKAIDLGFNQPIVYHQLWSIYRDQSRFSEAIAAFEKFLALQRGPPEILFNFADKLVHQRLFPEAAAAYRLALARRPAHALGWSNFGCALLEGDHLDDAIAAFTSALKLSPDSANFQSNLAKALLARGRFPEAIAAGRRAVALDPNFAIAHCNLGQMLLTAGDFSEGWRLYAYRWRVKEYDSLPADLPMPRWDGSDPAGKRIFCRPEQGFGDTIQFIRYVPLLIDRGARIVIGCQPELLRLLQSIPRVDQFIAPGQRIPPVDSHCAFLDLPVLFHTTLNTIPAATPYLFADPVSAGRWKQRIAATAAGDRRLNVGLVWAGRPTHLNDSHRSLSLAAFAPLAAVPGVRFFSLQKGDAAKALRSPPPGLDLVDWTADLHDFADTAALLSNLDLLITVDTSVAHVAGALGKPVWVLLPFVPDWGWLLTRPDSPWYPTMRLFRQPSLADWPSVIAAVAAALESQISNFKFQM